MTDGWRRARTVGAVMMALLCMSCASQTVMPDATPSTARPSNPSSTAATPPAVLVVPARRNLAGWTSSSQSGLPLGRQLGTARVTVDVATAMGGTVKSAPGPDGIRAFRFPGFTRSPNYPRAVIRVQNSSDHDELNPGDAPFTWGADFKLDQDSWAPTGVDNGDNLVQRGLSSEPVLYKAEVDHDIPACTVRGTDGTLIVRATEVVLPHLWYRMRCSRTGDQLQLRVTLLDTFAAGSVQRTDYRRTVTGPIGPVQMADRQVPISIGGKLAINGGIITQATDQFNGWVAQPMLQIDRVSG